MPKPVLGIIGSIGAGKSAVAAELARRGGYLISADHLGHDGLLQPFIKAAVIARWGAGIQKPTGEIDRKKLAAIVFADAEELKALQLMQFPYIGERTLAEIAKAEADPSTSFIVLDAAVLLEAGWKEKCDRILFVDAPRPIRLDRVQKSRGWSDEDLRRREASQISLEEKRKAADAVIVNAGSLEEIKNSVDSILPGLNVLPQSGVG